MRTLVLAGLFLVGLVALAVAMPKSDTETLDKFGGKYVTVVRIMYTLSVVPTLSCIHDCTCWKYIPVQPVLYNIMCTSLLHLSPTSKQTNAAMKGCMGTRVQVPEQALDEV